MNRRAFFRRVGSVVAGAYIAPALRPLSPGLGIQAIIAPAYTAKHYAGTVVMSGPMIGGISRESFSFWRNKQQAALEALTNQLDESLYGDGKGFSDGQAD